MKCDNCKNLQARSYEEAIIEPNIKSSGPVYFNICIKHHWKFIELVQNGEKCKAYERLSGSILDMMKRLIK